MQVHTQAQVHKLCVGYYAHTVHTHIEARWVPLNDNGRLLHSKSLQDSKLSKQEAVDGFNEREIVFSSQGLAQEGTKGKVVSLKEDEGDKELTHIPEGVACGKLYDNMYCICDNVLDKCL